ncbi:MAG: T9SS type A sorting domain-containing protein, partial [Chitinophagaceae bacterium]
IALFGNLFVQQVIDFVEHIPEYYASLAEWLDESFGLQIPTGATVCGIRMTMGKRASGINVLAYVSDYRIRLLKNGTMLGANRAKNGAWSGTEAKFTYGGPSDLWGTSWTADDVNNANFGIAISAEINGLLSLLPSAHINDVSMTVFYSFSTLPIRLVSFTGQLTTAKDVRLSWITSGEEGNTNFIIQRSTDGSTWKDAETIAADETGVKTSYSYTDKTSVHGKMYYRLAIRNSTGAVTYSEVVPIMERQQLTMSLYPNPASESVTITSAKQISSIKIFNAMGNSQQVSVVRISDNSSRINTSPLPAGIYYVQVDGEMMKLVKK